MRAPTNSRTEEARRAARFRAFMTAGLLLTAAAALAAVGLGRYGVAPADVARILMGAGDELPLAARNIVLNVRLPRILLALCAGAGLSIAGAAFQSLFANPLASPDTLGVATGASFGAVLAILFGWPSAAVQASSLAMGLAAVALVVVAGRIRGESTVLSIILSGMMTGALFTALVSLVKYAADPQDVLPSITFWMMGSLTGASYAGLAAGAPALAAGALVLWLLRWPLNAATLPPDEARSLGIPSPHPSSPCADSSAGSDSSFRTPPGWSSAPTTASSSRLPPSSARSSCSPSTRRRGRSRETRSRFPF